MLSIIFLFMIMCSVSFVTATYGKNFELFLPFSTMGISIFLYFMGMMHLLRIGSVIVCIAVFFIYVYSVIRIVKHRLIREFVKSFFTPAFTVFMLLFVILLIGNYGKLAVSGDEFSCWIYRVKIMADIDDFTTASDKATFQSYPPIMALWQYMIQKVSMWTERPFIEWKVFFSYQLFAVSVVMPLLKDTQKSISNILAGLLIVFFVPAIVYQQLYWSVDIDAFVGILAGIGFAVVLIRQQFEKYYLIAFISMLTFCLVLAKDVGVFFAVFILLAFYIELASDQNCSWPLLKKDNRRYLFFYSIPLAGILIAKYSWRIKLITDNIVIAFDNKIKMKEFLSMLILHSDETWMQQTVDNTRKAFYTMGIEIPQLGIMISYFEMVIILAMLLYLLEIYQGKKESHNKKVSVIILMIGSTIVYAIGMGATYISNFDQTTAINLGSYNRYMGMPILALLLATMLWGYNVLEEIELKVHNKGFVLACIGLLIVTPVGFISDFLHGDYRRVSFEARKIFSPIESLAISKTDGNDKICIISQEDWGGNQNIYRYLLYPRYVGGVFSLGTPFYEGDVYSEEISSDEWMSILIEDYDYVGLHHINDYFVNNYADCFSDSSRITDGTLWLVDKNKEILVEVQP